MMFGQRMASATHDAAYYDAVELALYNTVLAGINIEGDRYFYVNPLEVVPEFCTEHTYMDHVKPVRQKWFGVACCPPNVARTLASLGQYIFAQDEEALYIHQFISATASTVIGENELQVRMESELLQNGKVNIEVQAKAAGTVKIRIPKYAGQWSCTVDGKAVSTEVTDDYLILKMEPGSRTVALDLDVKARWVAANPKVREDAGKAALMKGPLVYCLEECDNGDLLSEIYVEENVEVEKGQPDQQLVGGVPSLCYPGIRVKNTGLQNHLYGELTIEKEGIILKAIPYCLWNNRGEGEMLVWHKIRVS